MKNLNSKHNYQELSERDVSNTMSNCHMKIFTCYLKSSSSHHCGVQLRFTRVINELKTNYLSIFVCSHQSKRFFGGMSRAMPATHYEDTHGKVPRAKNHEINLFRGIHWVEK
jgi:hypothetical protein